MSTSAPSTPALSAWAPCTRRRRLLLGTAAAASLALPAHAQPRGGPGTLPGMTEGPFYPPRAWRSQRSDWDADLTRVHQGQQVQVARGEHLALDLHVADTQGRAVDGCEVEIWQCDTLAVYQHPDVATRPGRFDPGFQGFGAATSARDGGTRFRTIRPLPYPGRTPHIHVKLRHVTFGELTSQLFVAGDPGNAGDFLWRRLGAAEQAALALALQPAQGDGLRWQARHTLVVPA